MNLLKLNSGNFVSARYCIPCCHGPEGSETELQPDLGARKTRGSSLAVTKNNTREHLLPCIMKTQGPNNEH